MSWNNNESSGTGNDKRNGDTDTALYRRQLHVHRIQYVQGHVLLRGMAWRAVPTCAKAMEQKPPESCSCEAESGHVRNFTVTPMPVPDGASVKHYAVV